MMEQERDDMEHGRAIEEEEFFLQGSRTTETNSRGATSFRK